MDLDTREAALDGRPLDLTAREFELLRTFLAAPGRVFTREMLLSRLWGYDFYRGRTGGGQPHQKPPPQAGAGLY